MGTGIIIGVTVATFLFLFLRARPSSLNVGPVEIEIPTLEPMESSSKPHSANNSINSKALDSCSGNDWTNCWLVDDQNHTLTWIGMQDSYADIGQGGEVLQKMREGYGTIFTIENNMKINICTSQINGAYVKGDCPIILDLEPGTYQIMSPGESGGFRVTQDGK